MTKAIEHKARKLKAKGISVDVKVLKADYIARQELVG